MVQRSCRRASSVLREQSTPYVLSRSGLATVSKHRGDLTALRYTRASLLRASGFEIPAQLSITVQTVFVEKRSARELPPERSSTSVSPTRILQNESSAALLSVNDRGIRAPAPATSMSPNCILQKTPPSPVGSNTQPSPSVKRSGSPLSPAGNQGSLYPHLLNPQNRQTTQPDSCSTAHPQSGHAPSRTSSLPDCLDISSVATPVLRSLR